MDLAEQHKLMQPTPSEVLILGCGDIGERLAKRLASKGYKTTGLRRSPRENLPHLNYQQCDLSQADALADVLQKPFSVIVITMTPSERSDQGYLQAYVNSCKNLVAQLASASLKPRLVIFVSSTAVYGQMDGDWVDENSPTEPTSFSGKRLLEAESLILQSDINGIVVRFSGIYGPNRNRLIEQVRNGQASSSSDYTNRIHADDCANSLAHLIELNRQAVPLENIYLASDNQPAPMIEVVSWLAEQLGVKKFLSNTATNERGNKRCSNKRLVSSGFTLQYPDYKKGYSALLREA